MLLYIMSRAANHPAAGKAGIAVLFAIEHHGPGLPEPVRSAAEGAFMARKIGRKPIE
jgi:hypothetical protein